MEDTLPLHPHVEVHLTGVDGNALIVLGLVQRELRRHGLKTEAESFMAEATSGDYGHLISTVAAWVTII